MNYLEKLLGKIHEEAGIISCVTLGSRWTVDYGSSKG